MKSLIVLLAIFGVSIILHTYGVFAIEPSTPTYISFHVPAWQGRIYTVLRDKNLQESQYLDSYDTYLNRGVKVAIFDKNNAKVSPVWRTYYDAENKTFSESVEQIPSSLSGTGYKLGFVTVGVWWDTTPIVGIYYRDISAY